MTKKPPEPTIAPVPKISPLIDIDESESGAGFKVPVHDILANKEARRLQYVQEKAAREANPAGLLQRLTILNDTIYGVKFLVDFDKRVELMVHLWKGTEKCHVICSQQYGEECEICQTPSGGTQGGFCYAVETACLPGYVFNNVDATWTKTNRRTGQSQTFPLKPFKLIEIPLGKNMCNITTFKDAVRLGYFLKEIWQIERKEGAGFSVPRTISEEDFKTLAGRDVKMVIPEELQKLNDMSKLQVMKLTLSAFDDVPWEKIGFKPPAGKKTTDVPEPDTSSPATPEADDLMS